MSRTSGSYDLAVIGGGTAGLVTAAGGARLGARVALIERDRLGGECLWTGCVPSKAFIRSAQLAADARRADEFGLRAAPLSFAFHEVLASVRDVIGRVQPHDDPARFRAMGVDVIEGEARFLSDRALEVDGRRIEAKRFVVATGGSTFVPPVDGLRETGFITHEEVFHLERQPGSLVVLGAGAIGVELGQVFQRLGTRVTVLEMADRILPREDPEVADGLRGWLEAEGIRFITGRRATRVRWAEGGKAVTHEGEGGGPDEIVADEILVATGKRPRTEGLGLEQAGVATGPAGIVVDDTMRTSAPHIWAAGDVTGKFLFTHVADYQARLVVRNAFFPLKGKADYRAVPWAIFTDPELARVGPTEPEARERWGNRLRVYRYPFETLDRAITERNAKGVVKILCDPRGRTLGAHILGPQAGTLIHEVVLAIARGIRIGHLSQMVHVYPTLSEGIRRAADLYYQDLFATSGLGKLLRAYLRWRL